MPPSSPTAAQTIHLTDLDQARAMFWQWQGRFEQLSSGRFDGQLRIVRGGLLRVVAVESNQRVLLRGRDTAGLLGVYPVIAGNAPACGRAIGWRLANWWSTALRPR